MKTPRGRYYLPLGAGLGGHSEGSRTARATSSSELAEPARRQPARQRHGQVLGGHEPPGRRPSGNLPGQDSLPVYEALPPSRTPSSTARASSSSLRRRPGSARSNPDETPPTPWQVIEVAKDMVKEGKVDEAAALLRADAPDANVPGVIFSAIGELAHTDKKTAKAMFKEWRAAERDATLPRSCHQFVRFDLNTVYRDMVPIVDIATPFFTKDEIYKAKVAGHDAFVVRISTRNYDQAYVVRDHDTAEAIAIERVKDTLETEPGIFNEDFLERFIDAEKRTQVLREMAYDLDYVGEVAAESESRFWQMAEQYGVYDPDEYETEENDFDPPDVTDDWIEKVADAIADERVVRWRDLLDDFMPREQQAQWLIDNVGIDILAAAQAAVKEDGPGQYLSSYDGELYETSSGFYYWLE